MNKALHPNDFFADRNPDEFLNWARAFIGNRPEKMAFRIKRSCIIPTSSGSRRAVLAFNESKFKKLNYGQQHDFIYALAIASVIAGAKFNVMLNRGKRPDAHIHVIHINP